MKHWKSVCLGEKSHLHSLGRLGFYEPMEFYGPKSLMNVGKPLPDEKPEPVLRLLFHPP